MTTPFRTALSNTVHAQRGSGERHHEIDPDGDVLLVLENPNKAFAPWDDCLDAGLQGLDLCEPDNCYFKKALSELWAKTLVHSEDGRRHLQAADWDADALPILMHIFHARTQNIPRSVDLEQLAKIAVLVDYYDCHDTVEFFATLWIHSLQEQLSLQCNRELILWLLVSVVFRRDDLFQAVTKIAVTKSKGPLPTLELPVLQSPIDQIDKRRQDAIADILGTLDKLGSDLLRGSTGCDFDCSSALFGALAKNMAKHNLMDPVPRAPFLGYGITALEKAVNCFQSPRWHHFVYSGLSSGSCELSSMCTNLLKKGLTLSEVGLLCP
ncbi:hypothetical protein CGMCC3_g12969 [Colletotrichum fructicola]|nr:uncharacterized protein CGMCC3_g12969 [Colletotrichum fructicola]KAE9571061.1 hypothetical protein CGMCC3_g12969 [Colletotrichum fructicola]